MIASNKLLIITGDAGESFETLYAKHRFEEAGYEAIIAAPSKKPLNLVIHDFEPGWDTYVERKGYYVESDIAFEDVDPADYFAVLLIGGRAPEYLRHRKDVLALVHYFAQNDKFIFALCHGIQILVNAGLVAGKQLTCYEHVQSEVTACGGQYISDQEAVRDGKLITGQTWESHPAFYQLIFESLATANEL